MKHILTILLLCCWSIGLSQTPAKDVDSPKLVTIHANGADVRDVLYQLFTQAGKSYVLQPGNHQALNLNLEKFDFDEALGVVCAAANLKTDLQNGIYYVDKAPARSEAPQTQLRATAFQTLASSVGMGLRKVGYLPPSVFSKKVTTNLHKAALKKVLTELSNQAHVPFELDPAVPAFKLDAVLNRATLKSALTQITEAAGLTYVLTNRQSILIKNQPGM
jgi:type II secretory pathway component GspD/PulD (secretin)